MVAYFCHHLSDNPVDLSDLYVDLSVIYVDLSDLYIDFSYIMSTCQIILLSVWHSLGKNTL